MKYFDENKESSNFKYWNVNNLCKCHKSCLKMVVSRLKMDSDLMKIS